MVLLRAEEVAVRLRLSKAWVYELVKRREIPHVKFGNRAVRFPEEEIERWLASRLRPRGGGDDAA